uniref:Heparan sulfate glucosamine 3-O-sulfotransferase 5 n=1 Tax=Cacopsylla melanoneura TaxID=428564 RepID=A0A8D9DXQ8_9HEMI
MKKGHPYVQESARIKPKHLPHQQLLIKLLISITLISLALIGIYDNHAFVQTKIAEYKSKIPEYPTKIHEYQSKYYDYENIVHEHVYDKNVNIDENYIDIDYKTDDENVYDEYGEEIRDNTKRIVKEDVLNGPGFKTSQDEGRTKSDDEATNEDKKEVDIYDETDDSNEQRRETRGQIERGNEESDEHDKGISRRTKTDISDATVKESLNKEKTDAWNNDDNEIESQVMRNEKHGNYEIGKDNLVQIKYVGTDKLEDTVGNVTETKSNSKENNPNNKTHPVTYLPNNAIEESINIQNHTSLHETNTKPFTILLTNETDSELVHTKEIESLAKTENIKKQEFRTDDFEVENQKPVHVNHSISLFKYRINDNDGTNVNRTLKSSKNQLTRHTGGLQTNTTKYNIFSYTSKGFTNTTNADISKVTKGVKDYENQIEHNLVHEPVEPQAPHRGLAYFARAKRRLPQALIIGVRKCGTRALLEMLYLHPRIQKAAGEVHFFDRDENYSKGLEWYRQQMPLSYPNQVTIEKSPSYFVTPEAPERIRAMNASVRLLVIVRDPVTRAISDYTQLKIHAAATSPGPVKKFEQLALTESGEINPNYRPIAVSMYHNFMYSWLEVFPKDQILIVNGDRLIEDPVPELQRIERFLNLEPRINHDNFYFNHTKGFYCLKNNTVEKCLRESKGRKHVRVHPNVISKMREYFNHHNQLFYDLVDENFDWPEE